MQSLSHEERMRLMKFVCSFAWADLDVGEDERDYVGRLVRRLRLDRREAAQVQRWLAVPPRPEEVDPTDVPPEHRQIFLDAVRGLVRSDGAVDEEESMSLALLEQLMAK